MKKQIKKLIRAIRLRLAYWHRKRFNKLMAKALGGERYYRYQKSMLNSVYGMSVTEMENVYTSFHSGETHADMASLYPNVMKEGVYPRVDTDKRDINILLSGIAYANTDSCRGGKK